jgi:hypothetical protein
LPKLDKAGKRALKDDFMKQAEIMKEIEKDKDWSRRMKAMGVMRELIVKRRLVKMKI